MFRIRERLAKKKWLCVRCKEDYSNIMKSEPNVCFDCLTEEERNELGLVDPKDSDFK